MLIFGTFKTLNFSLIFFMNFTIDSLSKEIITNSRPALSIGLQQLRGASSYQVFIFFPTICICKGNDLFGIHIRPVSYTHLTLPTKA